MGHLDVSRALGQTFRRLVADWMMLGTPQARRMRSARPQSRGRWWTCRSLIMLLMFAQGDSKTQVASRVTKLNADLEEALTTTGGKQNAHKNKMAPRFVGTGSNATQRRLFTGEAKERAHFDRTRDCWEDARTRPISTLRTYELDAHPNTRARNTFFALDSSWYGDAPRRLKRTVFLGFVAGSQTQEWRHTCGVYYADQWEPFAKEKRCQTAAGFPTPRKVNGRAEPNFQASTRNENEERMTVLTFSSERRHPCTLTGKHAADERSEYVDQSEPRRLCVEGIICVQGYSHFFSIRQDEPYKNRQGHWKQDWPPDTSCMRLNGQNRVVKDGKMRSKKCKFHLKDMEVLTKQRNSWQ